MRSILRPGMREAELWSILHQVNIDHGGGWIDGHMLCSGPRTNPWYQEVSQRVIENGDMVALDSDMIGPSGYLADISRSWICGDQPPTTTQRDAYQHAYEEIHFNIQRLRPGISFRELSEGSWPRREAYRQQHYVCCYHGVGLCDEYPKIYYPEDWEEHGYDGELQSGMVLSVESYSGVVGGEVGVKLEDMVLITDDGHLKLTVSDYEKSLLM
jgi:Xaa-Pro aminopeptidase